MKIIIETREGDVEPLTIEVQMQADVPTLRIYPTKAAAKEESQKHMDGYIQTKDADIGLMIQTLEDRLSYLKTLRDSGCRPVGCNL